MPVISSALFKQIRRIQIRTTHLVNDLFAGPYRSIFKGRGIEFEEVREYQPGDEIRSIDWNVTARMGHPFVKNFREERELTVMLVIDISASSHFGSVQRTKSELIAEIGAVLAFSAIKNQDKIGLILFSDRIEKYLPPKKGLKHVLRIIRELLAFKPKSRGTDMRSALLFLGKVQKKGGICFLISDFMCSNFDKILKTTSKNFDLVSIEVTDPYEKVFPDLGLVHFTDLETEKEQLVDTSDLFWRQEMAQEATDRHLRLKKLMKQSGGGLISINTETPYINELKKFFKMREKKR